MGPIPINKCGDAVSKGRQRPINISEFLYPDLPFFWGDIMRDFELFGASQVHYPHSGFDDFGAVLLLQNDLEN